MTMMIMTKMEVMAGAEEAEHQQKGGLRQIRWYCILTLLAWTLRPLRPVRPVHMRHIWLHLVRLEALVYTGFRPDTCN